MEFLLRRYRMMVGDPGDSSTERDSQSLPLDEVPEFGRSVEALSATAERAANLSKWCTSVSLSVLGFYLLVLLQLIKNTAIPSPWLARVRLLLLVVSLYHH